MILITVFMSSRHDFVKELLLTSSKGNNKKKYIFKLWLLCSAHRLMMYGNTCMKFYEHILNGFKVVEQT